MAVIGQSIEAEIEWFDNNPLPDEDDSAYYEANPGSWFVTVQVNGRVHYICGDPIDPLSGCKTVGEAADLLAKWATDRKYTLTQTAISAYLFPEKTK